MVSKTMEIAKMTLKVSTKLTSKRHSRQQAVKLIMIPSKYLFPRVISQLSVAKWEEKRKMEKLVSVLTSPS